MVTHRGTFFKIKLEWTVKHLGAGLGKHFPQNFVNKGVERQAVR